MSATRRAAPDRRQTVTIVAVSLIVAHLALRLWAISGGWFFGDDFSFLADVATGQDDVGWFFREYGSQLMPLAFVLVLPVAHAGAFAWWAVVVEMLLFQVAAALACWWMLRTLFGNRLRILVPLTIYLFSTVTVPSLMWWAAGLNSLTVQPFIFGAIGMHVMLLRTGRRRWAVAVTACLAAAFVLYLKALLIVPVLAIVTIVYAARGSLPQRLRWTVSTFRVAWFLYAVPLVAYVAAYVSTTARESSGGDVDYADLVDRFVVTNLSTAAFGGPWRWLAIGGDSGARQLADPPQVAVIACLVLIGGAVVAMSIRHRGVLLPLTFLVPYVVVTVLLLAYGRAGAYGMVTTAEIRYWADFVPYVVLAVGLATMPVLGMPDVLRPRHVEIFTDRSLTRVGTAYVVVFVIGSVFSTVTYVQPWHDDQGPRPFITTARAELASRSSPVPLADQTVPGVVVPQLIFPDNLVSRVLSPLGDEFTTPEIANDMQVLTDGGFVVPAFAGDDLVVDPANFASCLDGSQPDPHVEFGVKTFDFPFWMSIAYRADQDSDVTVTVGDRRYRTRLLEGAHTVSMRTDGAIDRVDVDLPAGTRLCVDALHLATRMVPR